MAGKVGFIGLGAMGGPMALNLARPATSWWCTTSTRARPAAVRAQGAELAGNAEAVAAAVERTILIVETTDQAEAVIAGERGIIKGAKPGHIVVCMTTIDPFAARELAEQLKAKGIAMVDAPVSGGTGRAQSGELSVIVGGDKDGGRQVRGPVQGDGQRTFPRRAAGQGLAMKLVNNMLVQVNTVAMAEALVLGVKAGLDPQTIYDVVRVSTGTSCAPWSCACRASSSATSRPAARSTSPSRTRSSRPLSPSGSGVPVLLANVTPAGLPDGPRARVSTRRTARRS